MRKPSALFALPLSTGRCTTPSAGRTASAVPEGPTKEHPTGPDLQSQLRTTPRQDERVLTREALRRIITAEASRHMPEGPALVRALLEAMSPGVSLLTAAEATHDEYGADDFPAVVGMITRAFWAYRQGENLDTSEVLALIRVEQEPMSAGPGPRDEASPTGALHGPPAVVSEVGEGPSYRPSEPQARLTAHPSPAHAEPGISHSRLSGELNTIIHGRPRGCDTRRLFRQPHAGFPSGPERCLSVS